MVWLVNIAHCPILFIVIIVSVFCGDLQVNGEILVVPKRLFRLKNIATITEKQEIEELHVWCDIGLELEIVRGTKVCVKLTL